MFTVKFYNDGVCERIMEADVVTATMHPLTIHLSKGDGVPYFSAEVREPMTSLSVSFAKVIVENGAGRTTEIYTPLNRIDSSRLGQVCATTFTAACKP